MSLLPIRPRITFSSSAADTPLRFRLLQSPTELSLRDEAPSIPPCAMKEMDYG